MRVLIFLGSNLRHKFFSNNILDNFNVGGLVNKEIMIEKKSCGRY